MPLACVFGIADPARGAARQARPLADRPEPALPAGRDDDERRRLRRRLVRRRRHTAALPQRPSGLERPEPARARRRDLVAPLPRAHPRVDGNGDPGDERASVPLRTLAVDAQRADPRVPADEARARARDRRLALRLDRGHHRLGDDVLPRPHLRARERPHRRRRADGRLRRGDRTPPRCRAPDPDDDRDERRAQHLRVPLLERGRVAVALLQHADGCPEGPLPGDRGARRPVGRDAGRRLRASRRPRGRLERGARVPCRHRPAGRRRAATVRAAAIRP